MPRLIPCGSESGHETTLHVATSEAHMRALVASAHTVMMPGVHALTWLCISIDIQGMSSV